jgi:hypothetical protein
MGGKDDDGELMAEPDNPDVPLVYANWFTLTPSPLELALDFGYQAVDTGGPRRVVRIASTWESAKMLKELLDAVIERREENVGEIQRPPGIGWSETEVVAPGTSEEE